MAEESKTNPKPSKTNSIKRRNNFWEPHYSLSPIELTDFDGNVDGITGIRNRLCVTDVFESIKKIKDFEFNNCDFYGEFNNQRLSFIQCNFLFCDLGRTTWKNIKFNKCKFQNTTLTQSTFESCQFIDCVWEQVGISGNDTIFRNCQINNPDEFINSAFLNQDMALARSARRSDNIKFNIMMHEGSKHKLSKQLMKNLESTGDDKSYYKALKLYLIQTIKSKEAEISYEKSKVSKKSGRYYYYTVVGIALKIENFILRSSGLMNNWGGSITRPVFIGLAIIFVFGLIYKFIGNAASFPVAFMTSFDITTLVGYTKHSSEETPFSSDFWYLLNVFLGLWWYAVFVPTIINRISKVRL